MWHCKIGLNSFFSEDPELKNNIIFFPVFRNRIRVDHIYCILPDPAL